MLSSTVSMPVSYHSRKYCYRGFEHTYHFICHEYTKSDEKK